MKKILTLLLAFSLVLGLTACSNHQQEENASAKYEHAFSVSEEKQVYFASSNLQYCPSTNTWRFAENAYDIIGLDNENISEDYDGYIDLFAWGATGINTMPPTSTDTDNMLYGNGHNSIADTDMDFGKVIDGGYRMFTHDEIHYLLMYRENAEKLFGYGMIGEVRGLFILPDDWQAPEGIEFTPSTEKGFENQYNWYYTIGDNENYTYNLFTVLDWEKMEAAGAVFLPAAGMRYGSECSHVGISGHYWTSSYYGQEFANCLCLFEEDLFLEGNFDRSYGLAVRLIKDAQ